jgi:hypothetical protein
MIICVHDDRPAAIVGVQLAVASIVRHAPGTRIVASLKEADDDTRAWFARQPDTELLVGEDFGAKGWDVKAALLLKRLELDDEAIWWDSDIIANGDFRPFFAPHGADVVVSTEDTFWGQKQGGDYRTRAWGFPVGRLIHATVNTCVLRVTRRHIEMLEFWQECMQRPEYKAAQKMNMIERPLHLLGDMEVFTAIAGSERFKDRPLVLLKRGTEIAQCFGPAGFRVRERLASLRRWRTAPPIVHSTNPKTWDALAKQDRRPPRSLSLFEWRIWYQALHAEMSTYTILARSYADELQHDQPWLRNTSPVGRALMRIPGEPSVVPEIPVAVFDAAVRSVRRVLGIGRFPLADISHTAPAPPGTPTSR